MRCCEDPPVSSLNAYGDSPQPPGEREDNPLLLSGLTTIRLGGPARKLVQAVREDQIVEAIAAADAAAEPVLLVAGGSNLVIGDGGFDGTVIRILNRGVAEEASGDAARLSVAAGEPWDELVSRAVSEGLAGIESLSGIPGSTGATPIQNVGAYGQEVADTMISLRAYDRESRQIVELTRSQCEFGYRSSMLRRSARYVVLGVTYELERSSLGRPVRYPALAAALGVEPGARVPLPAVREAVLSLRRRRGMVIDQHDPDSVSAGSFFINPILSLEGFTALERRVAERLGEAVRPPAWPEADVGVKTSAAWLIERAGFHRGYGSGRAGISLKHTLALVNRGGATTAELIALARHIREGVGAAFGVELRPEPTLVGVEL
jgi:UDP-N-acetylmuramate dehydrogenase